MRAGEDLVAMTPDMLRRIFDESGPDFSAEICPKATLEDLDAAAIKDFRKRWREESGNDALKTVSPEQLLEDAELISADGVTYAALILLGKAKSLGKHLAQAEVIFEYRSTEATGPANQRVEYRQGFLTFFDKLWQTINLRNDKQSFLEGFVMRYVDTFRESSSREAILNALSHRDYRHPGSVFVRQYPRRLEIVSPGGLPTGITPDNMIDKQFPRNRRIAESLLRCGLVERSGQGANRMLVESVRDSKPLPDYSRSDEHEVFLRLKGDIQDSNFVLFLEHLESERSTPLSSHEFLGLDLIRHGASLPAELREFGQALKKEGWVQSQGHGRGSRLVLSPNHYVASKQSQVVDHDVAKATLLTYLEDHRDEGTTVGELLEKFPPLSRGQIKALLSNLKAEGKAHTVGRTKGGRWHPGKALQ